MAQETSWTRSEGTETQVGVQGDQLHIGRLDKGATNRGEHGSAVIGALATGEVWNGTIEAVFRATTGIQNMGVIGRWSPDGSFYVARIYRGGTHLLIARNEGGTEKILAEKTLTQPYKKGRWRIRFTLEGDSLTAQAGDADAPLNDTLTTKDTKLRSGKAGVRVLSANSQAVVIWESFSIDDKNIPFRFATPTAATSKLKSTSTPLTPGDILGMSFPLGEPIVDLSTQSWTVTATGDEKKVPVRAGESILAQGFPTGEYLYRVRFELPAEKSPSPLYLLDLGPISVADITELNGERIGAYGAFGSARPVHGSSWVPRRYPIPASKLRFGQTNDLTVKVAVGVWGGIYRGPAEIRPLLQQIAVDYALRDSKLSAVAPLLSDAAHLNRNYASEPLAIRWRVADLLPDRKATNATLKLVVHSNPKGAPVVEKTVSFHLHPQAWTDWITTELPQTLQGNFTCSIVIEENGQPLYQQEFPFQRRKVRPDLSQKSSFAAKNDLTALRWNPISEYSVGSFGARELDARKVLDPQLDKPDTRGALASITRVDKDSNRVLIFQNDVQKTPLIPHPPEYYQDFPTGREYDGFNQVWPFGYIRLGHEKSVAELAKATWTSRSYRWKNKENSPGELTVSKLSPAFRLRAECSEVGVFEDLADWGLGGPSHLAYATAQGIQIVKPGVTFSGNDMTENWALVWFHDSRGWNDFDIPWLLVFERKTNEVAFETNGIRIASAENKTVGTVLGMPLHGVRLLPRQETAAWSTSPAQLPLAQIRRWSRALLAFPQNALREVAVDYRTNNTYLRESFQYEIIRDEWNTPPLKAAPTSPVLALALSANQLNIRADADLTDYALTTLHGPYLVAEEKESVIYQLPDLLRPVREAQVLKSSGTTPADAAQLQQILDQAVTEILEQNHLEQHPWPFLIQKDKLQPGTIQPKFSYLVSTLPFLSPATAARLKEAMAGEMKNVLLASEVLQAFDTQRMAEMPGGELMTEVEDAITRKRFRIPSQHTEKRGIDLPFWQSLHLFSIWQFAHYVAGEEPIRKNWPLIEEMFGLLPHSHDWATLQSWDSFSGYRIGNGLQESGGLYAGYAAVARMADKMGDSTLRDKAAGLSVLQLVGMSVANTGIEYYRANRPWSGKNDDAAKIAEGEHRFAHRYIEFNEFVGSSPHTIGSANTLRSASSYIHYPIPDIMRAYPEFWKEENDYFFRSLTYDAPLDMVHQMERATPERVTSLARAQLKLKDPFERAIAARVLLNGAQRDAWETVMPAPKTNNKTGIVDVR